MIVRIPRENTTCQVLHMARAVPEIDPDLPRVPCGAKIEFDGLERDGLLTHKMERKMGPTRWVRLSSSISVPEGFISTVHHPTLPSTNCAQAADEGHYHARHQN